MCVIQWFVVVGLLCSACSRGFMTAVGLLKHARISHNLQLFLENGPYTNGVLASHSQTDIPSNDTPVNLVTRSDFVPIESRATRADKFLETLPFPRGTDMTPEESRCNPPELCLPVKSTKISVSPASSQNESPATVISPETSSTSAAVQHSSSFDSSCYEAAVRNPDSTFSEGTSKEGTVEGEEGREDLPEEVMEGEETCCSSQKCGVELIPGTHESLQKCCYAVAPKKRKRHMETKHMPSYWRTRFNRRRMLGVRDSPLRRPSSRSQGTIYIDLKPESGEVSTSHSGGDTPKESVRTTNFDSSHGDSMGIHVTGMTRDSTSKANSQKPNRGSVFIKPRAVFSIPISYTIPTQALDSNTNRVETKSVSMDESAHSSDSSPLKDQNSSISNVSSYVPCSSSSISTSLTSESQIYGIDIPSLISQATRQFNLVPSSSEYGDMNDKDVHTSEDGEGKLGRKRRYPTTKPYKCDQCDNAFNQRIHLKKHMSKHTGERLFEACC